MSFEEPRRIDSRLRGEGWRRLAEPVPVRCYIGGAWMRQPVEDVNDETRQVRIGFATAARGVRHVLLDPGSYVAAEWDAITASPEGTTRR